MLYDENYWKSRKMIAIKHSIEILEFNFGVDISRGDTLIIREYAEDFISGWKKLKPETRMNHSMDLSVEIAGKFMMHFYNFRDIEAMHKAVYNTGKLIR